MFICLERGANDLRLVQLMTLPSHHLLLQHNPEWFILRYRPTQVVLEKRPLIVCVCVCVYVFQKCCYSSLCIVEMPPGNVFADDR